MKPDIFIFYKEYKKKYILNDIMAGLLIAIIALPLSIALGLQSVPESVSSNGIQMGLITAVVAGFLISFLGGSRFQIGGPTAAFVVIIFGYLANPEIGIAGLQIATIMAGFWLLIMGISKAGVIIKYIPHSIVVGFTTGIGLTLIFGQIKDLFGLSSASGSEFIPKMISYAQNINEFNYVTFLIGIFGLALILVLNKISRKIPSAIIAIILCTGINLIIVKTVGDQGVQTIGSRYGEIKAAFYPISFVAFSNLNVAKLIIPSLVIAMLGAIESLLSATVADSMTKTSHNPSQELIGQGVANIASACLGGMPATGAIARTSANINAGAKSSIAGMIHAVLILLMYFTLMDVVKYIPLTAFAAILISVALRMCDFPSFIKILKFSFPDAVVLLVTCGLTLFKDLVFGVIGGMGISLLLNIPYYRVKTSVTKDVNNEKITVTVAGNIYVFNIEKVIKYLTNTLPNTTSIKLDLSNVKDIDVTACERIILSKNKHKSSSIEFVISGASPAIQRKIKVLE